MDLPFVQVIGNGDAFGSGGRYHTCFMVHTGASTFLMDLGATSVYGLKEFKINTESIDFIVLTHFHGDHYGGVPFFLLDALFVSNRTKPLTIVGPAGCQQAVENLTEALYPEILQKKKNFDLFFEEYQISRAIEMDDILIEALPVIHSPPTNPHGLRISFSGKRIGFSGDTSWTDNLSLLAEGTDIFICECNHLSGVWEGHLSHEQLAARKDEFKSKRILLTHLGDLMIEHSHSLEFEVAEQGQHYII